MNLLGLTVFFKDRCKGIFNLAQKKLSENETQKILANIGWLSTERLIRMALGFIVGVWVSRYLGPEQLGLYSYAISFIIIFGVLATLGLERIVVREFVKFPDRANQILGTALILKIFAAIATYLLIILCSYLLHSENPETHLIVSVIGLGVIFQALDPVDFWFQSQVQSKYTAYAKSVAFLLVALSRVILILIHAPLIAFAWTGVAEILITTLGLVVAFVWKKPMSRSLAYCHRIARQLLRDSAPLILSGIMIMIYGRIDQIMILRISGEYEAGLYSAAVTLAEAWNFVPLIVVPSVLPNIIETWQTDEGLFYQKLQFLYNSIVGFFLLIAVPTTLLSWWIVPVVFGVDYAGASPMLAILIWASLFSGLGIARSSFLTAMNWASLHFLTVAGGCVINVSLNFAFIPMFGGLAAAVTTLISYSFAGYFSCFFSKRLIRNGKMMTAALCLRWR